MAFHIRLDAAIRSSKFTRVELAEILKVDSSAITHWTKGKNKPQFDVVVKLCELLGVPIGYLCSSTQDGSNTVTERAAYESFERILHERGPNAVLALLEGSVQPWRDLGEVTLPDNPPRHHKRPNVKDDPPDPVPLGSSLPGGPKHPDVIDLGDPSTRSHGSPPVRKKPR
jgi:transcriptional regulator with XRE-family HTH domain